MHQLTISDGRAGLRVSELCLGTMYFGYRTGEATAFAILDRFLEAGGTFLDTANNYGQWHGEAGESERVIGRWMRSRGVAGTMIVATKVGARTTVPGDPDPRHWQGLAARVIREDAETSLRNLRVNRLDLYYAAHRRPFGPASGDRRCPLRPCRKRQGRPARCEQHGHLADRTSPRSGARGGPARLQLRSAAAHLPARPARTRPAQPDHRGAARLCAQRAANPARVLAAAGRRLRSPRPVRPRRLPARSQPRQARDAPRRRRRAWRHAEPGRARVAAAPPACDHPGGASSVAQLDEILAATELKLNADTLDRLDRAGRFAS